MSPLSFVLPGGETVDVVVHTVLNAGYAGRDQAVVAAHVAELAELGVPAPASTPAVYPVAPYLAQQTERVLVPHGRTSGEVEWALVVTGDGDRDVLLAVASDHTDRDLEVHGVGWSKNASPDVLSRDAWRLVDVADHLDQLVLTAWVSGSGELVDTAETVIQEGPLGALLSPGYWLDLLRAQGLRTPGTVLLSGTLPMRSDVDQFARRWRVQLADPVTGLTLGWTYEVDLMPRLDVT